MRVTVTLMMMMMMIAGCVVPVEGNRPLHYLSVLLTDDIPGNIVTQTNLYAQQFIDSHSCVRQWSKGVHDLSELKWFLAITVIMGLVRYPQIESHWHHAKNIVYYTV